MYKHKLTFRPNKINFNIFLSFWDKNNEAVQLAKDRNITVQWEALYFVNCIQMDESKVLLITLGVHRTTP